MNYLNDQAKFEEVTVSSYKKPLAGQKHRSSDNFKLSAVKNLGMLKWSCPEGISFSLKRDLKNKSDPVLKGVIKNGDITKYWDYDDVYIADPNVPKQWSDDYFSVKITPILIKKYDTKKWISQLVEPETEIININLPGTHDSAAIAKTATWYSPYSRQRLTIGKQLDIGIRMLDIRLKIRVNSNSTIDFLTCHGEIGSQYNFNTYEAFDTVIDSCEKFLDNNSKEFVLMSVKIDDWSDYSDKEAVFDALDKKFQNVKFKKLDFENHCKIKYECVQGKIVLLNRITDDTRFGPFWNWKNNDVSPVALQPEVCDENGQCISVIDGYVQDCYTISDKREKMEYVKKAILKKDNDNFVWNFLSCCHCWFLPLETNEVFLRYLESTIEREKPVSLGWFMMDFADKQYITEDYGKISVVDAIIDLNVTPHQYFALNNQNPAGFVKFQSAGAYTVEFTLKYKENDKIVEKKTGRMLLGEEKNYDLPSGASEYEVSCLVWNGSSWKDKFDKYTSDVPFNCTFRTYGALPNSKMEMVYD